MTEQERVKKELHKQLDRVKQRLQILDLIEEKFLQMRELAQRVAVNDLNDEEIQKVNKQARHLEEQIRLLDRESTQLC